MSNRGFFSRLISGRFARPKVKEVRLQNPYPLGTGRIRIPYEGVPISMQFVREGITFHIHSEAFLDTTDKLSQPIFLLIHPDHFFSVMGGFIRLVAKGDTIILGNQRTQQTAACSQLAKLELRHLSIRHDGDGLIFRKLVSDAEITLSPLSEESRYRLYSEQRQDKMQLLRAIYGGPFERLSAKDALTSLTGVNRILQQEPHRPLDERGKAGGVINLPDTMTPIIVGDLHAQLNNLLTLLSQNRFLDALEAGTAALIILGDAIHSEEIGHLDEMDDSMLIMDFILKLKLRYPGQLFYVRGNHDSYSSRITKQGISQCLIWEAALRKHRGNAYVDEMGRFYDSLPYIAYSKDYIACHAAPIKTRFSMDDLINIHKHPELAEQLVSNRLRQRTSPAGYTNSDVRHFRKMLNVSEQTPFLVSHSPLDRKNPLWTNAGGIENHHIVFSANTPWIGVYTRVHDRMVPLSYRKENLLPIINEQS